MTRAVGFGVAALLMTVPLIEVESAEPIDVGKVNDWFGWPDVRESAYPKAYEIIHQIAPNKMHALCECQGLPAPGQLEKQKTPWLYCLPWYVGDNDKWNPKDWVAEVYLHETYVTSS